MVIAVKTNPQKFVMEKSEFEKNTPTNEKSENNSECDETNISGTKTQEYIGNCKEYRIENNKTHLRIIGNCNKIRVNNNNGHLEVIGNTTRVKIVNNSGKISYTGNCGKVYLGRESPVKQVDYIGNSGILKVVHEDDLSEYWKRKTSEKTCIGRPAPRKSHKDECCDNQRNSEKEKFAASAEALPTRSSTEIKIDTNGDLCLHITNNVSISNAESINLCNRKTIRIGTAAGNIVINNSFKC